MSRFYVGQRVRLVRCVYDRRNVGREALVKSNYFRPKGTITSLGPLLYDTHYIVTCSGNGEEFIVAEWQLEPITDSYDVTSWDTCVWKPEHLRSTA